MFQNAGVSNSPVNTPDSFNLDLLLSQDSTPGPAQEKGSIDGGAVEEEEEAACETPGLEQDDAVQFGGGLLLLPETQAPLAELPLRRPNRTKDSDWKCHRGGPTKDQNDLLIKLRRFINNHVSSLAVQIFWSLLH